MDAKWNTKIYTVKQWWEESLQYSEDTQFVERSDQEV